MSVVIIETEDFSYVFPCSSKLFHLSVSLILEQCRFELHASPLICKFFSTVNTTVQQNLQLVEPCSTEVLKIWRAYHKSGFSSCLEGWHFYLPPCSRVRKMLHVESQPWCYRIEFLKLGTVDILSQIIFHLFGAVLCIVEDLAASLASPYQVLGVPGHGTQKHFPDITKRLRVVLSFPRHCQISWALAETHWSVESGLGARSPTSVGQFPSATLCLYITCNRRFHVDILFLQASL